MRNMFSFSAVAGPPLSVVVHDVTKVKLVDASFPQRFVGFDGNFV